MKTREQLLKDLAFWQDKVNRSRKESLRSIRVLHLQHVQRQLAELEKSSWLLIKKSLLYTYVKYLK